jgi:uncharacterized protein (TIGR03435 family)
MRSSLALLLLSGAALAQKFDVASIKPMQPSGKEDTTVHPGSVTMRNVRLRAIIRWAYDLKEFQVAAPAWMGAPGWLGPDIDRFEVLAKTSEGTPVPRMREMMQALLAERFHLAVHRETREMAVFVMTAPKPKPALHPAPEAEGPGRFSGNGEGLVLKGMSMAEFGDFMAGPLQVPVLDRTGLPGHFDFTLSGKPTQPDDTMAFILGALEDQLGLKLQRQKAPVEMLIVDRADQKPTEN